MGVVHCGGVLTHDFPPPDHKVLGSHGVSMSHVVALPGGVAKMEAQFSQHLPAYGYLPTGQPLPPGCPPGHLPPGYPSHLYAGHRYGPVEELPWGFRWSTLLAAAALGLALLALLGFGLVRLHEAMRPRPPAWALELLPRIADERNLKRGFDGYPEREAVQDIFLGTHIEGYPAGVAGDEDFITVNSGHKIEGQFGKVILSPKAAALKWAMEEQGWKHRILFHGTENPFVNSILAGGFLHSHGWHGVGIYATRTFGHAQCYSPGEGESILELAVYWNPANESRYFNHVAHNSLVNDVYVIRDPLCVMPLQVLRCCPKEIVCR